MNNLKTIVSTVLEQQRLQLAPTTYDVRRRYLEQRKRKKNWQRNHVRPVCSKTLQKIFTPMNYNRSEQQLESFASM